MKIHQQGDPIITQAGGNLPGAKPLAADVYMANALGPAIHTADQSLPFEIGVPSISLEVQAQLYRKNNEGLSVQQPLRVQGLFSNPNPNGVMVFTITHIGTYEKLSDEHEQMLVDSLDQFFKGFFWQPVKVFMPTEGIYQHPQRGGSATLSYAAIPPSPF